MPKKNQRSISAPSIGPSRQQYTMRRSSYLMSRSSFHEPLISGEASEKAVDKSLPPLIERLPPKALRICFLRNMDHHFGGVSLPVSSERYKLFEKLLEMVTQALRAHVTLTSAVARIHRIDGTEIAALESFCEGDIVVCCCKYEPFVDVGYKVNQSHMRMLGLLIRREERLSQWQKQQQQLRLSYRKTSEEYYMNSESSFEALTASELPPSILSYLDVGKKIFSGRHTAIFEGFGKQKKPAERFAIKLVNKQSLGLRKDSNYKEIEIMRRLQCQENVIELVYTIEQPEFIYIVVEFLDCDIYVLMRQHGPFKEALASRIMNQVASGLEYIHSKQIVHRDIKPENLLARLRGKQCELDISVVKIADFGLATYYNGRKLHQICGTPSYMAPEILRFDGYDFFVDCWSLGVTLYCLLCRRMPYGHSCMEEEDIYTAIVSSYHCIPKKFQATLSSQATQLINSLLVKSPTCRLSASEIRHHPFLQM